MDKEKEERILKALESIAKSLKELNKYGIYIFDKKNR